VLLTPNAPLFLRCDRWRAQDQHKAARAALGIEVYRIHDQRHSYAVRATRAGTLAEVIARQLGHANAVLMLKIYGRFMPSQQERDKWERIAAAQDIERIADPVV
jgi:integrase